MAAIPGDWDEILGPFFDWAGLLRWQGWSDEHLQGLIDSGLVLTLESAEGAPLFVRWQFSETGDLLPHLNKVLPVLRNEFDAWDAAAWLRTPPSDNETRTAAEILRDGSAAEVAEVLMLARRDVHRLSL